MMAVKNRKILYSVAKDSNNELINAIDALKGSNYFCPVCGSNLVLRKSGKTGKNSKRPHFAHKALTENCTPETALHYTFKTLAFEKFSCLLKDNGIFDFQWDCQFCTEVHRGNLLKKISTVKLEYNLSKCQPDIALLDANGNVFAVIEVIVTHKLEPQVVEFYKDNNIVVIEHVLTSDLDLVNIDEKLSKPEAVNICFNPKCEQCGHYKTMIHMCINASPCYRCGSKMKYSYIKSQNEGMVRGSGNHLSPDCFKKEEVALARSKGVILRNQYSKTSRNSYLANTCNNCNTFIGNHYLFSEYISQEDDLAVEKEKHLIGYQCDACEEKRYNS